MMQRSPTSPCFPLSLTLAQLATSAGLDPMEGDASACGLFSSFATLARDKGFPKLAYGVRLPLPLFQQKYMLFHHGLTDGDGTRCGSVQLAATDAPDHDGQEKSFQEILQSTGTPVPPSCMALDGEFAIAAPAQHFSGATGTLWLQPVSGSCAGPAPGQSPVCQLTVFALAQLVHASMTECLLRQHVPESLARITSREKEILRWTADGKTVGEISQIINIAERTVKFHLHNIMNKLNAINKTQATVKAAALGMLRH